MGFTAGGSVGSLLVPGSGSVSNGAGVFSLGGTVAPPSACLGWSPVLPFDFSLCHFSAGSLLHLSHFKQLL